MLGIGDVLFTTIVSLVIGAHLPEIEEQYRSIIAFLWMLIVFAIASYEHFGGM